MNVKSGDNYGFSNLTGNRKNPDPRRWISEEDKEATKSEFKDLIALVDDVGRVGVKPSKEGIREMVFKFLKYVSNLKTRGRNKAYLGPEDISRLLKENPNQLIERLKSLLNYVPETDAVRHMKGSGMDDRGVIYSLNGVVGDMGRFDSEKPSEHLSPFEEGPDSIDSHLYIHREK